MDNRAVSPVVGKLLAAGLTVLYIAGVSGLLLNGVLPEYRTAAGAELGERVLANAAGELERVVAAPNSTRTTRTTLDPPATLRGSSYRLHLRNGTLRLDHPDDRLDASAPLSLPPNTTVGNATWNSGGQLRIRASGSASNRTVRLEEANR